MLPTRYSCVKLLLTETASVIKSVTSLPPVGIGIASNVLFEVRLNVLMKDVQLSVVAFVEVWLKLAGRPVVFEIPSESREVRTGVAKEDEAVSKRAARIDRIVLGFVEVDVLDRP